MKNTKIVVEITLGLIHMICLFLTYYFAWKNNAVGMITCFLPSVASTSYQLGKKRKTSL